MKNTSKISIDLCRPCPQPVVGAVQNDYNTRNIAVYLYNNSVAWPVPDGVTAAVGYRKPDGTAGLYDKLPDGADALTISKNTVTAILAPQVLTAPGIVSAVIILTDDSMRQLSTFPFHIFVEKNPAAGLVESDNYINVVGNLSDLVTEDKTSLVAAINEIARNNGGTISDEQIAQAVADYLEKNPPSGGNVDLTGYATEQWVKDQNYLAEVPEGYAKTEDIPTKPEDINAQPAGDYALRNELPKVPVQSVNGKTGAVSLSAADVKARPDTWMPTVADVGALPSTYTPPDQTAEQVGADPKGTAETAVSQHNTSTDSHGDLRLELKALADRLTAFFDSDDQTLDELSEIVAYITNNKTLIESITTSKVSVTDIIDNLTTNVANKPLSAAQGLVLKDLIDTLNSSLSNYALASAIPTKVSALVNDAGYLTEDDKAEIAEIAAKLVDSGGTETIETWQTLQSGVDYTVLNKAMALNRPVGTYLLSDNAAHSMAEVNVSAGEKYALTLTVKQSTSADYPSVCLLFTDGSGTDFLDPDTYGYDGFCGATSSATAETVTDYEVTVPNGATKMFVCPRISGETPIIKKYVTMQIEVDNTSAMVSPLYEKKAVFAGDSICAGLTDETGVRGWAQRIGEKYAMDWQNKAISGGTITSGVEDSAGCIGDTDFGDSPDYIIIEGGVNDADLIGEADTNGNMPEKFGTVNMHQFTGEFDNTKFCDAVNALFRRVVTDYKGSKIGFIVAHKMGGYADTSGAGFSYTANKNNRRYYFETIIQLCKKWGIPYLDLWEGCYLNPMLPAHNSGDDPFYHNSDFQHLRAKGYDYITPMIARWMETL